MWLQPDPSLGESGVVSVLTSPVVLGTILVPSIPAPPVQALLVDGVFVPVPSRLDSTGGWHTP